MTVTKEQFVNRWATTLAAGLTINGQTLTLTSVAGLPTTGQIRFLLGTNESGEKVLAQLNGTTTLTGCTRGAESSTAATHLSGEAVTAILTAGALNNALDGARPPLATVAGVNMNNGTAQTLYTVPSVQSGGAAVTGAVVTHLVLRNASAPLGTVSWSAGFAGTAFNDVIADATHTELSGAAVYSVIAAKAGAALGGTAATLKLICNILQGGSATATVDVLGFLV
jgi:hypothetical protein